VGHREYVIFKAKAGILTAGHPTASGWKPGNRLAFSAQNEYLQSRKNCGAPEKTAVVMGWGGGEKGTYEQGASLPDSFCMSRLDSGKCWRKGGHVMRGLGEEENRGGEGHKSQGGGGGLQEASVSV